MHPWWLRVLVFIAKIKPVRLLMLFTVASWLKNSPRSLAGLLYKRVLKANLVLLSNGGLFTGRDIGELMRATFEQPYVAGEPHPAYESDTEEYFFRDLIMTDLAIALPGVEFREVQPMMLHMSGFILADPDFQEPVEE